MDHSETIVNLRKDKPKHYVSIIKKTPQLFEWVKQNSLAISDKLTDHIHSAITQESNICQYGGHKKYSSEKNKFIGCGPASKCKCTREKLSYTTKNRSFTDIQKKNINEKRKRSMIKKYGCEYNSQRSEIKKQLSYCRLPDTAEEYLKSKEWLYNRYVLENTPSTVIAEELGVYYSTVLDYCRKYNFDIRKTNNRTSIIETQIIEYIKELGHIFIQNDRTIIHPKELDIVIPSHKLAIEINGLYWHSYHPDIHVRNKQYNHLDKTERANKVGYDLFHITDWQWNNKNQIIKSMIKNKLGMCNNKIYARKTTIKKVDATTARNFYSRTHLKGFKGSTAHYGLYYNNTIVMCMSVSIKHSELHIERLSSEIDTIVTGGANKLLNFAIKSSNVNKVISYCDRNHSNGNVYEKMGFELIGHTGTDYFWTNGTDIINRQKTQHKNMKKWLPLYNSSLTEKQNMFNNNYRIYYGCGSFKYQKIIY